MKKTKIKFGYEIDTGKEIEIPASHTVITGLTNLAGKTTAIMGLIQRSGLKAIVIKTKIGEKAITEGSIIPPFYKESFDWEYAVELLESSRKEKLKFERSWIIKYAKTAANILEFKKNIDNALAEGKLRELEKSVLITLQAYLEKIIPELTYAPLSHTLDIKEGINIMDLERFKEETQGIIIKSVLEEVLNKEKGVIVIIPEAWRYLPEGVNSPVKRPAVSFIRQGATNENYLWIDSQDITTVSKVILKQVSNWILGYQSEKNEIERTLDQLPIPKMDKPKSDEIATLKTGQFFVATPDFTKKAYAQPSWLSDEDAKKVALGKIKVEDLEQPVHIAPYQVVAREQKTQEPRELASSNSLLFNKKLIELREDFISNRNDFFNKFGQINDTISKIFEEIYKIRNESKKADEDEIVMRVLQKMPVKADFNFNPAPAYSSSDKEALIREVLARVPKSAGSVTYEVSPLEKIKKDFLEEAKNKILSDISSLSDDAKKILKYLEQKGAGCKTAEIVTKGFLLVNGGGNSDKINKGIKELETISVARKDKGGTSFGRLKDRIKELLLNFEATEDEIENIYNHTLANLLGAKNEN